MLPPKKRWYMKCREISRDQIGQKDVNWWQTVYKNDDIQEEIKGDMSKLTDKVSGTEPKGLF